MARSNIAVTGDVATISPYRQLASKMPSAPPIPLKGSRVLIVDDDPVNAIVLSGLLSSEGYLLAEAETGEGALAKCDEFHPDLVVLDVRLPGIDGFDTCREIKNRYGAESPPVIFITARNSPDDIANGFAAGGVDYLTKPVSPREAKARVRTHLSNRLLVRQLNQTLVDKNHFLGMAAHDLRNPLASIRSLAEQLCEGAMGPLTDEQVEVVTLFAELSRTMLNMVNELLDVAVIEAGQLKLEPVTIDLNEHILKAVRLCNIHAARKNTKIVFESGHLPILVSADAAKLRQVVDNLLSNAVKYSPLGSTITVEVATRDKNACFAIRDQGPGIPESERSRLFKEFGTLSVQSTAGEKSTGLGLAICRRIVEAHQGTISAENLPERGCKFEVKLPLQPDSPPE